jgi:hypothetical protein
MGWKLISRVGLVPITENWVYKATGRNYRVIFNYGFDNKGNKWLISTIILIVNNKKTYNFFDFNQLNKFLTKRKIPNFPEKMVAHSLTLKEQIQQPEVN